MPREANNFLIGVIGSSSVLFFRMLRWEFRI